MKFNVFNERNYLNIPQLKNLDQEILHDIYVVANVLPFRVNNFVIENLIDWSNIPNDPMFQLTFPQKSMLSSEDFELISNLLCEKNIDKKKLHFFVSKIRKTLNPHPSEQQTKNVPYFNGKLLSGLQHKYKETVLFFPAQGQTCHSYCTFCFRWAQFVGDKELRFSSSNPDDLISYLNFHKEITDVIFTGGDPLVAKTKHLINYIEPLLHSSLNHVKNIRIGTKSLSYWPYRFISEDDSDDLLRLFDRLVNAGKHVAIMAHYNHFVELYPDISQKAIKRILQTGAMIRSQAPILQHINNDAETWKKMWCNQVNLGIVPYYMFIERDTGAYNYFKLPLEKCYAIYQQAIKSVSGLCRTVRGPAMSASPGKIEIQGIANIKGEKVFVLRFIQARNPEWVQNPFFAKYNPHAAWLTELEPAFGDKLFFFEKEKIANQQNFSSEVAV